LNSLTIMYYILFFIILFSFFSFLFFCYLIFFDFFMTIIYLVCIGTSNQKNRHQYWQKILHTYSPFCLLVSSSKETKNTCGLNNICKCFWINISNYLF